MREVTRFRYSREKLRLALFTALGLTAMFTLLTWMVSSILWPLWANFAALSSSLVFLAFFSLKSGLIYWRDDAVLAIMPTGISDKRFPRTIPTRHLNWSMLREIELVQREDIPQLIVRLWPAEGMPSIVEIEMNELDADSYEIVEAISKYQPVREVHGF